MSLKLDTEAVFLHLKLAIKQSCALSGLGVRIWSLGWRNLFLSTRRGTCNLLLPATMCITLNDWHNLTGNHNICEGEKKVWELHGPRQPLMEECTLRINSLPESTLTCKSHDSPFTFLLPQHCCSLQCPCLSGPQFAPLGDQSIRWGMSFPPISGLAASPFLAFGSGPNII